MNINIWFHIFNSVLVLASLFVGYRTYKTIRNDWVRIMPLMLIVAHFGLFYANLILRDFGIYVVPSPQSINTWVHIIIAQTLTTILMMYTVYIYEYRHQRKLDSLIERLEKRCNNLHDQISEMLRKTIDTNDIKYEDWDG